MRYVVVDVLVAVFAPLGVVAALVAAIVFLDNPAYVDVGFQEVFSSLFAGIKDGDVLRALWATLYLAGRGLVLGLIGAAAVILVAGLWPNLSTGWLSIFNSLRAVPLTLLIPFLAVVPLFPALVQPPGLTSHIPGRDPAYIIALGSLLYMIIGAAEGIDQRNSTREGVFRRHVGLGRFSYFREVLIYEMTPSLLGMLRVTVLFALVLAIVLEQLIAYPGIGRLIQQKASSQYAGGSDFSESIALLYWVGLVGTLIDLAFRRLRSWLVPRERATGE